MMRDDHAIEGFRDPLRQAIIGESLNAPDTRTVYMIAIFSALPLGIFLLTWFQRELAFYSRYYFELLMSLCS